MKKLFLSCMAILACTTMFAFDKAVSGETYYPAGYQAYGLDDGTVAVVAAYITEGTEVLVPGSVEIWSTEEPYEKLAEYEVSQIGLYDAEWSKGWSFYVDLNGEDATATVTKLVVEEGVKLIEESAFGWKMTALEEVELPTTLEGIGAYAFAGLDGLKSIICKAAAAPELLPVVQDASWSGDHFKGTASWDIIVLNCVVTVPSEAAKATYDQQGIAVEEGGSGLAWSYWGEFYKNENVVVDGGITSIVSTVEQEVKAVKVIRNGEILIRRGDVLYNLQGSVVE